MSTIDTLYDLCIKEDIDQLQKYNFHNLTHGEYYNVHGKIVTYLKNIDKNSESFQNIRKCQAFLHNEFNKVALTYHTDKLLIDSHCNLSYPCVHTVSPLNGSKKGVMNGIQIYALLKKENRSNQHFDVYKDVEDFSYN